MSNLGILVPIVTIIVPFVFVIAILWMKSNEKHKRNKLQAELYAKAIEHGRELPPNLFEEKKKNNSLRTGIILICIGIGITIFMFFMGKSQAEQIRLAAVGLIPLFLGIGNLIIHFIWKKQGISDDEE